MKKVIKINPSAAKHLLNNIQPNKPIKIMVRDAERILYNVTPKAK
jgi:hypothetical protein